MCEMKWVILAGFLVFLVGFGEGNVPKKSELPQGKECAAGSRWTSRCNSCQCSQDGFRSCDSAVCDGQEDVPEMRCAPDTKWMNDCNTCSCTSNGRAMCTKIGCDSIITNQGPGNHNSEKEITGPITKSSKNDTKKVVCVANRMFIKDCNTCWCNDDGTSYICTRKVCVPDLPDEPSIDEEKPEELRIIKRQCRPDEVFELDCNMCRCNPDGKSFSCTRRACVEEDIKNTTPRVLRRLARATPKQKVCDPGQEFRFDCNKCLCSNDGFEFSCTRFDCYNGESAGTRRKRAISEVKEISTNCTNGTVFEVECNTCRCNADGRATCTNKPCNQELKKNDQNPDVTESDPGFRCNPGEQFKKNCNDCTCSADGRSFFCTVRLCEQGITPGITP